MTSQFERILEDAHQLSTTERALLAQSLIASLEQQRDTNVDPAWIALTEQRLQELNSGTTAPLTWDQLKSRLKQRC